MRTVSIIVFCALVGAVMLSVRLQWIMLSSAVPIIVGLVALVGVLLNLEWNQRQLRANFMEERSKAERKRQLEAKQAAFVRVAEAMTNSLAYLLSLPDRKLPTDGKPDPDVQEIGPALTALHFYCDYETLNVALKYGRHFAEATAAILGAKMDQMRIDGDLEISKLEIARLTKRQERLDEETILLFRADVNHPLLPHVRQAIEAINERLSALHSAQGKLHERRLEVTELCRAVLHEKISDFQRCSNKLLLCARRELSFPIEEEKYAALLEEQTAAVSQYLKKFSEQLKAQNEQANPSAPAVKDTQPS